MAEAKVLAIIADLGSLAVGKLSTIAKEKFVNEYGLLIGVQQEARKLLPMLRMIKAVLHDAELKQIEDQMIVKEWMESLKQIMYEADDVLDEWHTKVSIFQPVATEGSGFRRMLFSCLSSENCSCFEPLLPILSGNNYQILLFRIDIASRIQGITASLTELSNNMKQLNLISNTTQENNRRPPRQLTSSMVDVLEVYGRDHDKVVIVSWLLSERSGQHKYIPVISIVGIAGFGKTTLAKLVLKDGDVVNTFGTQNIWWVCVSEPFDRERVAREIIEQATRKKPDVGAWEVLLQRLLESVGGKMFLLVLDDPWSEDENDWNELKSILANGVQGSRILVTTRKLRVAKMMGSTSTQTHMIGELSEDSCWSMFRSIAFWGRPEDEVVRLDGIGQELAKKCRGVPLAVKTLASHMRWLPTVSDWKNVLNNGIWKLQHDSFFPALFLSYHALPSPLKLCFMYCSVFSKDTILRKDILVKLWMAQGFLGSDERDELEMIGAAYFDNLAMASFFQDFEKDNAGKSIVSCKMHDLVHDFSQFLSGKECLVVDVNPIEEACSEELRHVNVGSVVENSSIYKAKNLRTLRSKVNNAFVTSEIFNKLLRLRSLVLSGSGIVELPSEVGSLLHLRYLDLSHSKLRELPETLCNLYNLQTLKLERCDQLFKLPEEIGKLSNLRYLGIQETYLLSYIPQSIGRLSHLRTLGRFIVSERCKIKELCYLNHLSGTLELKRLELVGSVEEAERAELHKKKKLNDLGMDFGYSWEDEDEDGKKRVEGVLEALQPDANLEGLVIKNYQGSMFPCWMMSRESLLPNLVKLKLRNCKNCSELPPLGNLQYLESLRIESLKSVKHITVEFYGGVGGGISFPKLKQLHLEDMEGLEEWEIPFSNLEKMMPRLYCLELKKCPKLMELPALGRLESLETIEIEGLESLKRLGTEFLGASSSLHGREEEIVFPKLRRLSFSGMKEWEEWDLPLPLCNLRELVSNRCPRLKPWTLRAALGKLQSLESLRIEFSLKGVRNVGGEIFGISDSAGVGNGESSKSGLLSADVVVYLPNLMELVLGDLAEWEEEPTYEVTSGPIVMPGLRKLYIWNCKKLKVLPHYMFSHSLRELRLSQCPQLTGTQPFLPPLLKGLFLERDVGVLSKSLLPIISKGDNRYPSLKFVRILNSPHSSLPEGLSKFTSLEQLTIHNCISLDLKPGEELRCFPMLKRVDIFNCDKIKERCAREDWANHLFHQIPLNTSIFITSLGSDGSYDEIILRKGN